MAGGTVTGTAPRSNVDARLNEARKELLDLGLRNPLINFRLLKARGVEVVDELSPEVFRILVLEKREMAFLPAPEETASAEPVPSEANAASDADITELVLETPDPALIGQPEEMTSTPLARHLDRCLQTKHWSVELQKRLLTTYYDARTIIEEQGVNILYLAFGTLEWYEDDKSDQKRRAPLILVPVQLNRPGALDRFHLRYTEEEIGGNLSLQEKLKADFNIQTPELPELEDLDVTDYVKRYEKAISHQNRWHIDPDAIFLSFFSFGKFLMYRDLDSSTWSEQDAPPDHPILSALLGDGLAAVPSLVRDDDFLDHTPEATALTTVVDADSTQSLAILDVAAGRNLVVQGPPGTGKSQTITNVIAQAIGEGKRVLFVAEKMAALEVVKRRLDQIALGDACLELHSHRTTKRTLLSELGRTLDLGKPKIDQFRTLVEELARDRDRLNEYCDAINTPVGDSGLTPYALYGELLELREIPGSEDWPSLRFPALETWTAREFEARRAQVDELQVRVRVSGMPSQHPFWGSARTILLPTELSELRSALITAATAHARLQQALTSITSQLSLSALETLAEARLLRDGLRRCLEAPPPGIHFTAPEWVSRQTDLEVTLSAGAQLMAIQARWKDDVRPTVWDKDVTALRNQFASYRSKWWRFLASGYRAAKAEIAVLYTSTAPKAIDEQLKLLDDVLEARKQRAMVEQQNDLGQSLFGTHWAGPASDWDHLRRWADWNTGLRGDIEAGRIPQDLPRILEAPANRGRIGPGLAALDAGLDEYEQRRRRVVELLQFDEQRRVQGTATLDSQALREHGALLADWSQNLNRLHEVVAFNIAAEACQERGLADVVAIAERWPEAGQHLLQVFRRARFIALYERAANNRPALRGFDGAVHQRIAERFRQLDQQSNAYHRAQLALRHWSALPKHEAGGQLGMLKREFAKKTRHMPIRKLMKEAGSAIQAIKPVFMMSPLSIATYLPPGSVTFDLVVFDEASQVRPVDAFGAVLRGRQTVVVGDSKQLPPTSFFDTMAASDDADEELVTSDVESILGLFLAKNAPQRMLRWHYRSRHHSLITVSNHEFYEDRLVVFPSPDASSKAVGLRYHYLPHTAYDRGKTRTNPEEARAVAQAAMEHARTDPDTTLGVVAFSTAQQQAILDQLEVMRRQDPSCEQFFANHANEPFFVKNLENVQGDERDVIFISVGYGKTTDGYLAHSFGPLNLSGGERRLNVLITRARLRCEVFTNLTADDLDLSKSSAQGVRSLKQFLHYAQTGILDVPTRGERDDESPFEDKVYEALVAAGYEVDRQVGSAGFFIDLAVKDPRQPGRYALAIECDGASYHSARSARDRDRLRQQVLEGLGWTFHRIWSTDWFQNPDKELRRTVKAIELALAQGVPIHDEQAEITEAVLVREEEDSGAQPTEKGADPYVLAHPTLETYGRPLTQLAPYRLSQAVVEVVTVESPVHLEEVIHRVGNAGGAARIGKNIRSVIENAVERVVQSGKVQRRGHFLWRPDMTSAPVRNRSDLATASRDLELVAPEEIEQAIVTVTKNSYGISREEIPSSTCRLLGFQKVTEEMNALVQATIDQLVSRSVLQLSGDHLQVPAL